MSPDTGSLGREFCFGTANSTKLEHLRHTPESDGNQLLVALLYLPNNFLVLQDLKMHAVFPLSEVMEMSFQYNLGICWNVSPYWRNYSFVAYTAAGCDRTPYHRYLGSERLHTIGRLAQFDR
jgi:hypothetical protein